MQHIGYKNVLILGLLIALILSINQCSTNKQLAASQDAALIDATNHYENDLGTITATKRVLELEKKDLKELLYSKDTSLNTLRKEFLKVEAVIQTEAMVVIDSVTIPFETKIEFDFERKGKHMDNWLKFNYNLNQDGFDIADFIMLNKQTSITGFKRKWLLGKQTYTTDITNTNPYIKIIDVQTVQVVVPKRFYDTRLFNIGVGFIGGMLVAR